MLLQKFNKSLTQSLSQAIPRDLQTRRDTIDSVPTETEDTIDRQIKERIEESLISSKKEVSYSPMDKLVVYGLLMPSRNSSILTTIPWIS